MKRILVTAAGGAPSINFTRSLRDAEEKYFILGIDCNKYTIHRSEADQLELCPKANDPQYIDYLNFLISKYKIDFLHAQPDIEVGIISENRDKLNCKVFLPARESIRILRDKYLSYEKWKSADVRVPHTILINTVDDLNEAYKIFGQEIWIREIVGAAGKGSLASPKFEEALNHINKNNGWGKYTAAERLKSNSITWMSIYFESQLVIAQTRERLYWEASNRTQSGVTGITGTGRTTSSKSIDEFAQQAIHAIDKEPHGIFSVDMTFDQDNMPNATEINIGKFFTTHHFFTQAGINFPNIYVNLAFNNKVPFKNLVNPVPDGYNWIRGMDIKPILKLDSEINELENKFIEQFKCIKN